VPDRSSILVGEADGANRSHHGNYIMTRLRISAAGYTFIADTNPDAPQTVAAFLKLLPYRQKLIHVRWSGEGCWIPLGEFRLGVDFENHTSHPSVGTSCSTQAATARRRSSWPTGAAASPASWGNWRATTS
jgi:hypothetical protein